MTSAPTHPKPKPERPLVLGIESSCDDTACAVLDGEGRVLSSAVSSQLEAHGPYGGVVPEIASREHLRNWPAVRAAAMAAAAVELGDIDVVAATRGPGLVGSLLVGLSVGKALAYGLARPFFAVHHLEGHLYSPFLSAPGDSRPQPARPLPESFVGLVVSGGHTALYSVEGGRVETLAETRDDAMGECFDKVGKRVGLPFPGGPLVDRLAELGELDGGGRGTLATTALATAGGEGSVHFRTGRCGDSLDFSYSGLKTQAIVEIERLEGAGVEADPEALLALAREPTSAEAARGRTGQQDIGQRDIVQVLAAMRHAAVRQVLDRVERLHRRVPFDDLAVSGGVAANRALRRELRAWGEERGVRVHLVPLVFSGDNAAMIAWAALLRARRGEEGDPLATDARSRLEVPTAG